MLVNLESISKQTFDIWRMGDSGLGLVFFRKKIICFLICIEKTVADLEEHLFISFSDVSSNYAVRERSKCNQFMLVY